MLSFITQNPAGSAFAIIVGIVAWPFVIECWNDWRREQFLRNNPSVIIVQKAHNKVDHWPIRLTKLVWSNLQNLIMLCCQAIISLAATVLRGIARFLTPKPSTETKPRASPPKIEPPRKPVTPPLAVTTKATTVTTNPPPTSVLKRRNPGERRRRDSVEQRVSFTESSNGKVATSYYYYNPSKQANQKSSTRHDAAPEQTPVSLQHSTASRLPTPYHFEKQQQLQLSKDENGGDRSRSSGLDKENVMRKPPSLPHISHSPGQKQIRAAMQPVTVALRKRRIELENIAQGPDVKRRIPVAGTRSAMSVSVHPKKRRERHQLVWEHLNKRPKSEEEKKIRSKQSTGGIPNASVPSTSATSQLNTPPSSFQFGASATNSTPDITKPNTATDNGSTPFENKSPSTPVAAPGEQLGAAAENTAGLATSSFQFGATGSAQTSSKDNATETTGGFQFGSASSTSGPANPTAASSFQFGAATSAPAPVQDKQPSTAPNPGFQFGSSNASSTEAPGTAPSSFQFGASKSAPSPVQDTPSTATIAPSFAFGAASTTNSLSTEVPSSDFQFGASVPASTLTPAHQPSFQFGSSAENTPAPGPVSNGFSSSTFSQQNGQSSSSFQFGGEKISTAPTFGATNGPPAFGVSSSAAPSFGASAANAPVFGMKSPSMSTNSASARRLARRSRR